MKLKYTIVFIGIIGLNLPLFALSNAEKAFDANCAKCHIKTVPSDINSLAAPPIMGVMRHIKMVYPNKKDAVNFIVDYVQNPSKEKALCMPRKIARFGLMPSLKGKISPKTLKEIANWLFENYPPANFRGFGMKRFIGHKEAAAQPKSSNETAKNQEENITK